MITQMFIALFLKTNQQWTLKPVARWIDADTIYIQYENGLIVSTDEDAFQTIPRNFSDDWYKAIHPNGYVKPIKYPKVV
mgnify:CR=1 FL=1